MGDLQSFFREANLLLRKWVYSNVLEHFWCIVCKALKHITMWAAFRMSSNRHGRKIHNYKMGRCNGDYRTCGPERSICELHFRLRIRPVYQLRDGQFESWWYVEAWNVHSEVPSWTDTALQYLKIKNFQGLKGNRYLLMNFWRFLLHNLR